jgi:hypothetical protein
MRRDRCGLTAAIRQRLGNFCELPEEGNRRCAAGMDQRRPRQNRRTNNPNFQQLNFRSNQPHRIRHRRRSSLHPVDPGRTLIAARLAHRPLARGRFFHLGPHCVQIVRSRDHRKQQNQHAPQRQQTLKRSYPACQPRFRIPPPQPVSRQRQQHPRQIEQQFHLGAWFPVSFSAVSGSIRPQAQKDFQHKPVQLVFQKPQTQVNMTTVPPAPSGESRKLATGH